MAAWMDDSPVATGTDAVVAALEAARRGDGDAMRLALLDGAGVHGWEAIVHRLEVAGRALAYDAVLDEVDLRALTSLEAEIAADLPWADPEVVLDAPLLLLEWAASAGDSTTFQQPERVWTLTALVAWLSQRLGYPPQVVA